MIKSYEGIWIFFAGFAGIVIVFLIVIPVLATYGTTVYGTVTTINTYQGAGQISAQGFGGSQGSTSALTYYNITATYQGHTYHDALVCNVYTIGARFPLQQNLLGQVYTDHSLFPTGC